MNLADAIWGESPISMRRLCVLATNMPLHGAVGSARGELSASPWQNAEELLALIAELIHDNTRAFVIAHSKKGTRPPKALKIPRPYAQEAEVVPKRPATNEELQAMFGPRRNG